MAPTFLQDPRELEETLVERLVVGRLLQELSRLGTLRRLLLSAGIAVVAWVAHGSETRCASTRWEWIFQASPHDLPATNQQCSTHAECCFKISHNPWPHLWCALTPYDTHTTVEDE